MEQDRETPPQEPPADDYGYDLVHEEARRGRAPETRREPVRAAPEVPRTDVQEDFGYDEAHGF